MVHGNGTKGAAGLGSARRVLPTRVDPHVTPLLLLLLQ